MPSQPGSSSMGSYLDEAQALRESAPRSDFPPMTLTSPLSVVEVYIHQARNMPAVSGNPTTDYYCVIEVTGSRQLYSSHVTQDTLHPVWNESFQVKCTNVEQMISISIFAQHANMDDVFVGVVVVPVKRVMAGDRGEEGGWYEMRFENNEMVQSADGVSKIELTFVHKDATPGLQPRMGWLTKRDNASQSWDRLFFILDPYNQMLRYFATPEDAQNAAPRILGEMNMRCCDVVEGLSKMPGVTNPTSEMSPHAAVSDMAFFKATTNFATLIAYADSNQESTRWTTSLRETGNTPDIRHLPPPPSLNAARGFSRSTMIFTEGQSHPPPSPPVSVQAPSRKGFRGGGENHEEEEEEVAPKPASRQSRRRSDVNSAPDSRNLPPKSKADESLGRILNMLGRPRDPSPPRSHQVPPPSNPSYSSDAGRQRERDRGGSPERGSIYDDAQREEAEALSIKYEASRKALADSMAKNREYEAHIKRLEAAASGKGQSSALVDHTRKQLAEAKNEIARLLNQAEELKRGGTLEGSAMEEALQTSNLQLKKSSEEIVSLRAANRKLSEDKAKLITDNTELANRFDSARQALAKHVGRERGGGAVGKGFIGEMQGNSAMEKRLREMEQRATVAAEGFQMSVSETGKDLPNAETHATDAQASMSAMEEEKLELANEIKRLQERLQRQAKAPEEDKSSKDGSDKRSRERAEDMKKVLEGERAALDEDKATLEKERRHLIILKGQLDRQQAAFAARVKDAMANNSGLLARSPSPPAQRGAASSSLSPIRSGGALDTSNASQGYSSYIAPSSPKSKPQDHGTYLPREIVG